MSAAVCSTICLYHHFLHGEPDPARLASDGLRPRPVPAGGEEDRLQREVYAELFGPVLGASFARPGVFLTPIDFYALTGTLLASCPRVVVERDRLPSETSVVTWLLGDRRVREPLSAEALQAASAVWTPRLIRRWFGRDRERLFWYVPQVGCFGDGPIGVGPVERPPAPA